jgi:hypothetical protein
VRVTGLVINTEESKVRRDLLLSSAVPWYDPIVLLTVVAAVAGVVWSLPLAVRLTSALLRDMLLLFFIGTLFLAIVGAVLPGMNRILGRLVGGIFRTISGLIGAIIGRGGWGRAHHHNPLRDEIAVTRLTVRDDSAGVQYLVQIEGDFQAGKPHKQQRVAIEGKDCHGTLLFVAGTNFGYARPGQPGASGVPIKAVVPAPRRW